MKYTFFAAVFCLLFASFAFAQADEINIIPQPQLISVGKGDFTLSSKTKILAMTDSSRKLAAMLNAVVKQRYGFELQMTKQPQAKNVIRFAIFEAKNAPATAATEAYFLRVTPDAIEISGDERGVFYGLQSLLQVLPADAKSGAKVPAFGLSDQPRFKYRGMHLDVARHFLPVSFVKKYIDLMSQYKFNQFHWHLTDDQGWRIEIKKYPKLTTVGQYRSESHEGVYSTVFKGDGRPVEGFYTQEEIKDVVAYAKARYINVVPEIELPGHASAALAAYPELGVGCAARDYKFEVKKTWGIFKEVFCPTEETFKFLEDVLDETIKLFPESPYIHIGGDEVLKDFWKDSPYVQELKKRENLKDEHEVQSYFVRRMEKFVNSKGKKIIGWDEILEGGVAPNATIMSWRGMKGGIEAAKAKHDVIMTPTDYCYLDYGQGDPAYELLNIGGYLPLEKVYQFDPMPKELTADEQKYILGGQANLWTEYIETGDKLEYMAFPRMLAIAESVWSRPEDKDFADFKRRLYANLPLLDKQNVNYRIPEPDGLKNVVTDNEKTLFTLTPMPGTKVFYTVDGSNPTENSTLYTKPIEITLADGQSVTVKTIVQIPTRRKSVVYTATIVRGGMRDAVTLTDPKPGVTYNLVVPIVESQPKITTGETRSILLTQFEKQIDLTQPFIVNYDGYFKAPQDGVYELQLDYTWNASLTLGGKRLLGDAAYVDKTNASRRQMVSGIVALKAGYHPISLRYGHAGGDAHFRFRWGLKGQGLRQINGGELVH
ncbi:MAG: family 20 glycosylhydrolase [Pyrinomonadaceae bacterium]